jgi:hypothetical protein
MEGVELIEQKLLEKNFEEVFWRTLNLLKRLKCESKMKTVKE